MFVRRWYSRLTWHPEHRVCPIVKQEAVHSALSKIHSWGPQLLWSPYNVARHSVWRLSDVVFFFQTLGRVSAHLRPWRAATLVMLCVLVKRFTRHMFQLHNLIMWFQRKCNTEVMIKKKAEDKVMNVCRFCFYAVFMANIKMLCLLSPTDCGIFLKGLTPPIYILKFVQRVLGSTTAYVGE